MAMARRPFSLARATTSSGERVPSDIFVCTCKSIMKRIVVSEGGESMGGFVLCHKMPEETVIARSENDEAISAVGDCFGQNALAMTIIGRIASSLANRHQRLGSSFTILSVSRLTVITFPISFTMYCWSSARFGSLTMPLRSQSQSFAAGN